MNLSRFSRVKPCVTHDIYKGFSIRKTHIIETTCNILSYRRDTIMVHTYAYVLRASRECRVRVYVSVYICVRVCVCVCVFLRVHIYTYRPNIILTPDERRTVKTSKTEARALVSRTFVFRSRIRLLRVPRRKSTVTANLEYLLSSQRCSELNTSSGRIESKK